jgi:phenylacetate-CoA ligase
VDLRASLTRNLFYPLWDIKDRSGRLSEWRSLERSQWASREDLERLRWARAGKLVEYAHRHCRTHRERLEAVGMTRASDVTPESWSRIPILTKQEIRQQEEGLRSDRYRVEDLVLAKTGGSTGTALRVYFDRSAQARHNAAALRSDRWSGWELGMRKLVIWGNPPVARAIKARIRNALHDRIEYLDTMEIHDVSLKAFLSACQRPEPFAIQGHAHSIFIAARWLEDRGEMTIRPRAIIATSMMLLVPERDTIERVFGCRVTDRYGCEEVGLIGCECEQHRGMHLTAEHLLVECLRDDGKPAAPGEEGRIVVTDLVNRGMPMIRYRVEDRGVLSGRACACGRRLPLLEKVTGRTADFLVRADRTLVAGVSLVERTLTAIPGLEQMQIVQEAIGLFSLRVVPTVGYGAATEEALVGELRSVFGGETTIRIEKVAHIAPESSGKYRFSISKVPY